MCSVPGVSVVVSFGRFPVIVLWCCVCDLAFGGLFVSPSVILCVFLVLFGVASDWLALIDSDCVPVTLYEIQELWCSCGDLDHTGAGCA